MIAFDMLIIKQSDAVVGNAQFFEVGESWLLRKNIICDKPNADYPLWRFSAY